jgi:hypothetical protein
VGSNGVINVKMGLGMDLTGMHTGVKMAARSANISAYIHPQKLRKLEAKQNFNR